MANIDALREACDVVMERGEIGAYRLTFVSGAATTTIRIVLNDVQSGADMVITNMTTLPDSEKSKGYGGRAVARVLTWAREQGFTHIEAVQVQRASERFWQRCGFRNMHNATNDFRYHPEDDTTKELDDGREEDRV